MATSKDILEKKSRQLLHERGVELEDIAKLVYFLQSPYVKNLNFELCLENVKAVLKKREVQNTILTGIQLDILAENGGMLSPLQEIVESDEGLYGIDEIMALSIVNVYGSIGFTNYGYIDKVKPGILKELNEKNGKSVHTFLDDIIGAIAAAAASRLAHAQEGVE
ncbi:phosphatidylglycerophosphatase A family protein [Vagococcus elongatus]|uniref:Phosphatidylglycerophosphatase A n=1 Tax=Vagococcus elongatus TaxID=180344 RepID=A0A430AM69_9ENTE|nr:phosphatidylglycerophosphatase A [Vagococcus elongatus]RSU09208.1 phosphatidylglycerophosphatase A [Vagococcus elongatus]